MNRELPKTPTGRKIIVACPCLNESARVVGAIKSLLNDPRASEFDILLLDGGSLDGTLDKVRAAFGERVEIIHNAHRLQAYAVNMAAAIGVERGAEYLVRADLHARYPSGYVSKLCDTAQKERANSVVVPMRTRGGNRIQTAAKFLFSTWLGNGGALHRTGTYRGWVNHGHHALFRIKDFARLGGYDTDFAANEDAEFDLRLTKEGGRIFLENEAVIDYFPRPSLKSSFRQFFRNGRFRVWTAVKHESNLGIRQLLPMAIVPILVLSCMLAVVFPWMLFIPLAYVVLVGTLACQAARNAHPIVPLRVWGLAAFLAIINHVGFSAGALYGAYDLYGPGKYQAKILKAREHPDLRMIFK